jgi:lactoylglutathione lyase
MITKLNTVALYVSDQERARSFYVEVLDFEVRTDAEMAPGARWLEVAPKGAATTFAIVKASDFPHVTTIGGAGPATLSTSDVQELYQRLKLAEVIVTEPVTEPWATYLTFTDPDGWEFIVGQA